MLSKYATMGNEHLDHIMSVSQSIVISALDITLFTKSCFAICQKPASLKWNKWRRWSKWRFLCRFQAGSNYRSSGPPKNLNPEPIWFFLDHTGSRLWPVLHSYLLLTPCSFAKAFSIHCILNTGGIQRWIGNLELPAKIWKKPYPSSMTDYWVQPFAIRSQNALGTLLCSLVSTLSTSSRLLEFCTSTI